MKTFCFYNGKGGVGKSFHTVMFASFLQYREGANVCVVDLESPDTRILSDRVAELEAAGDSKSVIGRYCARLKTEGRLGKPYDVVQLLEPTRVFDEAYAEKVQNTVWNFIEGDGKKYDYILFDFPAVFIDCCPAYAVICTRAVDLTAIPIDLDNTTRKTGLVTADVIRQNGGKCVLFWNDVPSVSIKRKGFLESGEDIFVRNGFEVLPQRIKSFKRAQRDSKDTFNFVRSTLCWPERYIELSCREIVDLYVELKGRIDAK